MSQQSPRRTFSAAVTIGELLRKPTCYSVPLNQRDFAWTSEEVDALWDDVTSSLTNGRPQYFLGAIVTSSGIDDRTRDIADGQQRLAAVSMIFAALAQEWRQRGDTTRADGVVNDYLGSQNRRTLDLTAKLRLNETNDPVYQKVVLKAQPVSAIERRSWPLSNVLLAAAFGLLQALVHTWVEVSDDPIARLCDLEEYVANSTYVILIEVGDESDAFVIFETLNDRGLELAVSDLVKNYLFSLAGSNIDRFKKLWSETSLLVGSENLSTFLRHSWLSGHEVVRERELYRVLRSSLGNPAAAREYVEQLRGSADLYAALLSPDHAFWSEYPPEARSYLDALLLFKVTQFRPVALAAMRVFSPDEVTKVLHTLVVISFRYTVVSGLGTGNLEKIYSDSALAIKSARAKSPAALFEVLRPAYVPDERFVEDFANKLFSKAPVARYILSGLNDRLEDDPEKTVADRSGRITLEHVLPRNLNEQWRGAMSGEQKPEEYADRIGNLTLLEKGRNKGISSVGFAEKKQRAFGQSSLAINRELNQYLGWTAGDINDRSRSLAQVAREIWQVSY